MSTVKRILIILSFPVLYNLTGIIRSHYHLDKSYFIVWGSIALLHWLNVLIVFRLLKHQQLSFKNIGFDIRNKKNLWFLMSYLTLAATFIIYLQLNDAQSGGHDLNHRLFEVFLCFTAGFCEELIWRGYGITSLLHEKLNKVAIVLLCSFSFCAMHIGVFTNPFFGSFILVFGIVFSIAFLYTQKLSLLMFIHMTYDLLIMLFFFK
jgi:membrane protease YdiL (CAAX protease family)